MKLSETRKSRSSKTIAVVIILVVMVVVGTTGYYHSRPVTTTTTTTAASGLQRIVFQEQDEYGPRQLAMLAGDVDSIFVPATNAFDFIDRDAWLRNHTLASLKPHVIFSTYPSLAVGGLQMNLNWKFGTYQPFASKNFRYAMSYVFDYQTYINTVGNGFAIQGRGPIPQGLLPYTDLFQFSYDPATAKEYFLKAKEENAYPDGLKITIYYNSGNEARKQGSLLFKDDIEKLDVGISVAVQELDWPTFLAKTRAKELPISFVGWAPDYADPDDYAVPFCHGIKGTYAIRIGYNNETVNKWIDEAAVEMDPAKRMELYKAVERQVVSDAPYIWISEPLIIECQRDWVKGWFYNPMYASWDTTPAAYGMYKTQDSPNRDTFTDVTIGDVDSMDPAWDYETFGGGIIELTLQRLVYYERDTLKIVPQLAKSWKVSSDGLAYTFHLDERARFNDGSPVTAQAVKFSLDRLVLMNDPDGPAWIFSSIIKGGPEYMAANTWQVTNETEVAKYLAAKGVEVIDNQTVQLTLDHAYSALLPVLAFTACSIVNPSAVNAHEVDRPGFHNDWMSKHGTEVGSGPFKQVEWTPKQRIVLYRNENFWNPEQLVAPAQSQGLTNLFMLWTITPKIQEVKLP